MNDPWQVRSRLGAIAVAVVLLVTLAVAPVPVSADAPPPVGTVTRFTEDVAPLPFGLTAGPDGNMWVAAGGIQRITPDGVVTAFPVVDADPFMITSGPDDNLWFTSWSGPSDAVIGRMTTAGVVTLFPVELTGPALGGGGSSLWSIVPGPDGNLWFTSPTHNVVGRITTAGVVTLFSSDLLAGTIGLTSGPDGNLWFTGLVSHEPGGARFGYVTPAGQFTLFDSASLEMQGAEFPTALTHGSDGNLWAADVSGVVRITPQGGVTKFETEPNTQAWGITTGADGNVWYAPPFSNQAVRVTPAGVMTTFPAVDDGTPAGPWINGIAAGPDGTVWWTNFGENDAHEFVGTVSRVVTGSLPSCSVAPFVDVPVDHQFCGQIAWMAGEGIAEGYPDGTFGPTVTVSRQSAAAFLYRLAGSPDGVVPSCSSAPFSDVPVDHVFCGEIAWMADEGIASGFPDGSFGPGLSVSRQSNAAFLYRYAGEPDGPDPVCAAAPFSDVPTTHLFCGEIDWLTQSRIANGYSDGTFGPTRPVARQTMASFLYNLDNLDTLDT